MGEQWVRPVGKLAEIHFMLTSAPFLPKAMVYMVVTLTSPQCIRSRPGDRKALGFSRLATFQRWECGVQRLVRARRRERGKLGGVGAQQLMQAAKARTDGPSCDGADARQSINGQ
jgi:hypothetical protein